MNSPAPRLRQSYKDLTLAQLRSFGVVCRLGSYAAAGRELLLTSPAVWEQMQALERHYGHKLLRRAGNGVAPTAEGERLLDLIQPVLAGLDSTRDVLQQHSGDLPRVLTVATNLRVLAEEISRGLALFYQRHPSVALRLIFTGNDVDRQIAAGQAEVGLTLEPGPDDAPLSAAAYEGAGAVDYLLVAPPKHALASLRSVQLKQILRYPLVLGERGAYSRRRVQEVLHRHNLQDAAQVAVETSSDEYTLSCVRAGMGIGITIGLGRGPLYQGLAVRTLTRLLGSARIGFLWKRGAYVPAAQRELASCIRTCLRGSCYKRTANDVE
jgi:DNA-binding transcriptional LysR family regulator